MVTGSIDIIIVIVTKKAIRSCAMFILGACLISAII